MNRAPLPSLFHPSLDMQQSILYTSSAHVEGLAEIRVIGHRFLASLPLKSGIWEMSIRLWPWPGWPQVMTRRKQVEGPKEWPRPSDNSHFFRTCLLVCVLVSLNLGLRLSPQLQSHTRMNQLLGGCGSPVAYRTLPYGGHGPEHHQSLCQPCRCLLRLCKHHNKALIWRPSSSLSCPFLLPL